MQQNKPEEPVLIAELTLFKLTSLGATTVSFGALVIYLEASIIGRAFLDVEEAAEVLHQLIADLEVGLEKLLVDLEEDVEALVALDEQLLDDLGVDLGPEEDLVHETLQQDLAGERDIAGQAGVAVNERGVEDLVLGPQPGVLVDLVDLGVLFAAEVDADQAGVHDQTGVLHLAGELLRLLQLVHVGQQLHHDRNRVLVVELLNQLVLREVLQHLIRELELLVLHEAVDQRVVEDHVELYRLRVLYARVHLLRLRHLPELQQPLDERAIRHHVLLLLRHLLEKLRVELLVGVLHRRVQHVVQREDRRLATRVALHKIINFFHFLQVLLLRVVLQQRVHN